MSLEAKSYFSQLTASVPTQDWQRWEREIQDAESRRHLDPPVMDILRARDGAGDETMQVIEPEVHTCTERWIQKAIDIEERQCIALPLNVCLF